MISFDEQKAAQAAAFLLHCAEGRLPLIKLLKLMYLAERLSFQKYGFPIVGDHLVSMTHGPVLSRTLDLMNGSVRSEENGWESWISDRAEHNLALRDPSKIRSPEQDLLALSDSDLEVLRETWNDFGHYDKWDLVEHTHTLPEWSNPQGSSRPIQPAQLLLAVGYSTEAANELMRCLSDQRILDTSFA